MPTVEGGDHLKQKKTVSLDYRWAGPGQQLETGQTSSGASSASVLARFALVLPVERCSDVLLAPGEMSQRATMPSGDGDPLLLPVLHAAYLHLPLTAAVAQPWSQKRTSCVALTGSRSSCQPRLTVLVCSVCEAQPHSVDILLWHMSPGSG